MDTYSNSEKDAALKEAFSHFYKIIRTLRSPEGCPWDREQTPTTLKENLIEESYECIEAIEEEDIEHIQEELGDLLLLITMLSYMYEQKNLFSLSDVIITISQKLVRRHPHVFSNVTISDPDEVIKQWESIKQHIERKGEHQSLLDSIPKNYPPLERAYKIQNKARTVGFDWTQIDHVWEKVYEEIDEFKEVSQTGNHTDMTKEFGDLLFALINVARFLKINPSVALHYTNTKFEKRFRYIEIKMKEKKKKLHPDTFQEMDSLWNESKKESTDDTG